MLQGEKHENSSVFHNKKSNKVEKISRNPSVLAEKDRSLKFYNE
jgi:hypothetical protein